MSTVRAWLASPRVRRLAAHDLGVFVAALIATGVLDSNHLGWNVLASAAITAVKVTLRQVLAVPPKPEDVDRAAQQIVAALPITVAPPVGKP